MEFDFLMFGYKNSYQQPYFKPKNNHSRVSILESEVKGLKETIKKKDVEISKMALNNMNNRNSLETAIENKRLIEQNKLLMDRIAELEKANISPLYVPSQPLSQKSKLNKWLGRE